MGRFTRDDILAIQGIDSRDVRVNDTETTGLDSSSDELLQVAVVDGEGNALFSELVRPIRHSSWPKSERVTGITPDDVAKRPPLDAFRGQLTGCFEGARLLVGYNLPFDLAFLKSGGIDVPNAVCFDVMREFSLVAQRRNKLGRLLWRPLSECARHYGVAFIYHNALSDARATAQCFSRMIRDDGSRYKVPGTVPYLRAIGN